jgi:hypothetical protein
MKRDRSCPADQSNRPSAPENAFLFPLASVLQRRDASMKPFSGKRARRNTAVAALLVWLFALSSGIANACLLEKSAGHAHSHSHSHVIKAGFEPHHAHVTLSGHPEAVEHDEHDLDGPKDTCLKVCDDGAKALVKPQASVDLLDPGMAPLVAVVWDAVTPVAWAPGGQMDELRPPIVGPPFRVRYSRLAL